MMFLLWVAAMAVLLAVILLASVGAGNDPLPHTGAAVPDDLLRHIQQACEINGVDPLVVVAIIDRMNGSWIGAGVYDPACEEVRCKATHCVQMPEMPKEGK